MVSGLDSRRRVLRIGQTHENQLGLALRQRVAKGGEIAYPGAMHRVTGVTQGAVDDLDGFLMPRIDDERDGARFSQLFPAQRRSS